MDDFATVLKKGFTGMAKSPVLIVAGLASGIVTAIMLLQYSQPATEYLNGQWEWVVIVYMLVATFVLPAIILPFLIGGALGGAVAQASGGKASWGLFLKSGAKNYLNLLIAGIGAIIINLLLYSIYTEMIEFGYLAPILMLVVFVAGAVIWFAGLMFTEFYDIAIVADGADFIRAFPVSIEFVRRHLSTVVPFFVIVITAKILAQLPIYMAFMFKFMALVLANVTYDANGTINETSMNATIANMSMINSTNSTDLMLQVSHFSLPSIAFIALFQGLIQSIVFAFVVSYKAEFYQWVKNRRNITDFDYDFSAEKKE